MGVRLVGPLEGGKLRYGTKQELIYEILRDAIMKCELAPGHRLIIQTIAEQFHVSPIPVREALRVLESEGLVEHRAHIGAVVSSISRSSVAEIFILKESLECIAARTMAEDPKPETLLRLRDVMDEMDQCLTDQRYEEWGTLNAVFHVGLAEASTMPMLIDMTHRVLDRWNRVRRYYFRDVVLHRLIRSQDEHHAILNAIASGLKDRAEHLVQEHNRGALQDYMNYLESASGKQDGPSDEIR